MRIVYYIVAAGFYLAGIALMVLVALQTSKSEGLSGILAGGGGGGGKVGQEKHLETLTLKLAYGWLGAAALLAFLRHLAS